LSSRKSIAENGTGKAEQRQPDRGNQASVDFWAGYIPRCKGDAVKSVVALGHFSGSESLPMDNGEN